MKRTCVWRGQEELEVNFNTDEPFPEEFIKLEEVLGFYFLLDFKGVLWKGQILDLVLTFDSTNIIAVDIAASSSHLYYVNREGKVFRYEEDNNHEEVVFSDNGGACVHGYVTSSQRVAIQQISAGGMGLLFLSDNGELWASGDQPQLNLTPEDGVRKVTFFDGRYITAVSSGEDFNAVIAFKRDEFKVSPSSDEVFIKAVACPQCVREMESPVSPQQEVPVKSASVSGSSSTSRNNERRSDNSSSSSESLRNESCAEEKSGVLSEAAARLFLTKQLSRVSSGRDDWLPGDLSAPTKFVSSVASYVYEGVKVVGDKLSRHMSGGSDNISQSFEQFEELNSLPVSNSDSIRCEMSEACSEEGDVGWSKAVAMGARLVSTEVWTWGRASQGQLGQGDTSSRIKPCLVSSASYTCARQLWCGSSHCVVLCLDGRTLLWGSNSKGQLCPHSDAPQVFSSPFPGPRALSAGASADLSAFLGLTGSVHRRGTIDEINSSLRSGEKEGKWARVLVAGNVTVAVTSSTLQPPAIELSPEQYYLEQLAMVWYSVVRPLLRRSCLDDVVASLAIAYSDVVHATALLVDSLLRDPPASTLLHHLPLLLPVYSAYLSALWDATTVSAFSAIARLIDFPQKVTGAFVDQLPSSVKPSPEAILACAFNQPFSHITVVYKGMLKRGNEDASGRLDQFTKEQEAKKREAEITRQFWMDSAPRLLDFLKIPGRRLVRDGDCSLRSWRGSHRFILFSDMFVHMIDSQTCVAHPLDTVWLDPSSSPNNNKNCVVVRMPEEEVVMAVSSEEERAEWVREIQKTLRSHLGRPKQGLATRSASYLFKKHPVYAGAVYDGRWEYGKLKGFGRLMWSDGRSYTGEFHSTMYNGYGQLHVPEKYTYKGHWVDGLQHGYGVTSYHNRDVYSGYYKEGLENGHGMKKVGHMLSAESSVYVGEWLNGQKHGYGVLCGSGQIYMGMWSNNQKNGSGCVVTTDGLYYEGTFEKDMLSGKQGVMVLEDGSHYEGELKEGEFAGKGVLTLASGDRFEGSLHGRWSNRAVRVQGTLHKNMGPCSPLTHTSKPPMFGQLCVAADKKWEGVVRECWRSVVGSGDGHDCSQAWQNVAVCLSSATVPPPDSLRTIPDCARSPLDLPAYLKITNYLHQAFKCMEHPLGRALSDLVQAYTTTYGCPQPHPLMLDHAVDELKSITVRLYQIVRVLFPMLPHENSSPLSLSDDCGDGTVVVSVESLLYPVVLSRTGVYPSLLVLYNMRNEHDDCTYQRRLETWNTHPDSTLMPFLGVTKKFWLNDFKDQVEPPFYSAIEKFRLMKSKFSPIEKLLVLKDTFKAIKEEVESVCCLNGADELLPLFQYVLVRASLSTLGSEIHFIKDFSEKHIDGEFDYMFSTLQALFTQILQERIHI